MPRRKNLIRPAELHATIPSTEKAKLDLALFSPLEGKIPFGAYQAFVVEAIRMKYEWVGFSLDGYGFPPGSMVRGSKETIEKLRILIQDRIPFTGE